MMKHFLIILPLLFIGCRGGLPDGYFSPVGTECDANNVLWTIYKDGHRDIVKDEIGRYTRCKDK